MLCQSSQKWNKNPKEATRAGDSRGLLVRSQYHGEEVIDIFKAKVIWASIGSAQWEGKRKRAEGKAYFRELPVQAQLIAGFHGCESTPRQGIYGRIHLLEMGALCQRQESLKKLFPVSLNSQ